MITIPNSADLEAIDALAAKLSAEAEKLNAQLDRLATVRRDLTAKELFDRHMEPYPLCGCGSGKKFKFCCFKGTNNAP